MTTPTTDPAAKPSTPGARGPLASFSRAWWLAGLILAGLIMLAPLRQMAPEPADQAQLSSFKRLPVQLGGRVKPLDTVARTSLARISGRSSVRLSAERSADGDRHRLEASRWLLDTVANPRVTDETPAFRISQPELKSLLGLADSDRTYFSYAMIRDQLTKLNEPATQFIEIEPEHWSPYQRKLLELRFQAAAYLQDRPPVADTYPIFRIDNAELLTIFGFAKEDGRYYSFFELSPNIHTLEGQATAAAQTDEKARDTYQKDLLDLYDKIAIYHKLKNSVIVEVAQQPVADLKTLEAGIAAHGDVLRTSDAETIAAMPELRAMLEVAMQWRHQAGLGHLHVIPPENGDVTDTNWQIPGEAVLQVWSTGHVPPAALGYVAMAQAWQQADIPAFNQALEQIHSVVDDRIPKRQRKVGREVFFNTMQPFITSLYVYVLAFILACVSWLVMPARLSSLASGMVLAAWLVHTAGLVMRVYLQGYAPVTNLYSSAVFVGWGSVMLGLLLERWSRNGVGSAASGAVGFTTLIIAHMLSLSGDTMEMMRAVLDSNFWLSTHVITVTIGYSGMFLAGLLAVFFIIRGLFDVRFDRDVAKSLGRMIYGVICFSTLFAFVGTVLGGIWADQSWGRFWGWDPKENGALLIVLWCAVILHARWAGYASDRGVALLALVGNIITAFSWFGVNMLEVGLHSYGFMSKGALALNIFYFSQIVLIGVGLLPFGVWLSPFGKAQAKREAALREARAKRAASATAPAPATDAEPAVTPDDDVQPAKPQV